MNTLDSISDGPVGHEELMQICGLTLPVFVLPATIHVAPINACLKLAGPATQGPSSIRCGSSICAFGSVMRRNARRYRHIEGST